MTDSIFNEDKRPARDLAEAWWKFTKIGDQVGGEILDIFEKPADEVFKAQRCFTIRNEGDSIVYNVGVNRTSYMDSRTDDLQTGDRVGFKFDKEIPPKQKGFSPAKSITIYRELVGPRISGGQARDSVVPEPAQTYEKKDTENEPNPDDIPF